MEKKKQSTRDELFALNAKLQKRIEDLLESNKSRRDEFAKAFNFWKPHSGYGNERLPADMTWEQIFVELGKLLAARTFYDLEGNVSANEYAIENLRKEIKEKINPNF